MPQNHKPFFLACILSMLNMFHTALRYPLILALQSATCLTMSSILGLNLHVPILQVFSFLVSSLFLAILLVGLKSLATVTSDFLRSAVELFRLPPAIYGTHCRTVSSQWRHYRLSGAICKHFCSSALFVSTAEDLAVVLYYLGHYKN